VRPAPRPCNRCSPCLFTCSIYRSKWAPPVCLTRVEPEYWRQPAYEARRRPRRTGAGTEEVNAACEELTARWLQHGLHEWGRRSGKRWRSGSFQSTVGCVLDALGGRWTAPEVVFIFFNEQITRIQNWLTRFLFWINTKTRSATRTGCGGSLPLNPPRAWKRNIYNLRSFYNPGCITPPPPEKHIKPVACLRRFLCPSFIINPSLTERTENIVYLQNYEGSSISILSHTLSLLSRCSRDMADTQRDEKKKTPQLCSWRPPWFCERSCVPSEDNTPRRCPDLFKKPVRAAGGIKKKEKGKGFPEWGLCAQCGTRRGGRAYSTVPRSGLHKREISVCVCPLAVRRREDKMFQKRSSVSPEPALSLSGSEGRGREDGWDRWMGEIDGRGRGGEGVASDKTDGDDMRLKVI